MLGNSHVYVVIQDLIRMYIAMRENNYTIIQEGHTPIRNPDFIPIRNKIEVKSTPVQQPTKLSRVRRGTWTQMRMINPWTRTPNVS